MSHSSRAHSLSLGSCHIVRTDRRLADMHAMVCRLWTDNPAAATSARSLLERRQAAGSSAGIG